MAMQIHRPGDLYNKPAKRNKPGKRGVFNVGRTTFYDFIEPDLERVELAPKVIAYTDRSVVRKIKAGIAAASRRRARG